MVLYVGEDVAADGETIGLEIERSAQGPVDLYLRSHVSPVTTMHVAKRRHRDAGRHDTRQCPVPTAIATSSSASSTT
jgi:hypothetical protein